MEGSNLQYCDPAKLTNLVYKREEEKEGESCQIRRMCVKTLNVRFSKIINGTIIVQLQDNNNNYQANKLTV